MLRRRDARRVARVTSGAADYLRNVLVPDGNGGDYHLDFVLLTSRGVVIIDMRDIIGNVFGGDQMTDWTLIEGARRTTFENPQSGLYDRIASVKAITQDTPVEGRIVFTKAREISEGPAAFHRDARVRGRGISAGSAPPSSRSRWPSTVPAGRASRKPETEPALSCEPGGRGVMGSDPPILSTLACKWGLTPFPLQRRASNTRFTGDAWRAGSGGSRLPPPPRARALRPPGRPGPGPLPATASRACTSASSPRSRRVRSG